MQLKTKQKRPSLLIKRWNKDLSISLIARGRVVFRAKDTDSIEAFCRGWFGDRPHTFGRTQFAERRAS